MSNFEDGMRLQFNSDDASLGGLVYRPRWWRLDRKLIALWRRLNGWSVVHLTMLDDEFDFLMPPIKISASPQ